MRINIHLVAVVFVCLLVSLATWNRFFPIVGDSTLYIANAVHLVLGGEYQGIKGMTATWFPPGTGLLVGGATLLFGDPVLAGRLVSLVASVLASIPLFLIAERLFGRRTAVVVGLAYALNTTRLIYAHRVSSEAVYFLLILVALLLWLRESEQHRLTRTAFIGACIGGAYYMRPEALIYLPFMLILSLPWQKAWKTPSLKSVLVICTVAGFMTLPYVYYLKRHGHGWALSGKSFKVVYKDCISLSKNIEYAAVRKLDAKCENIVMDPAETTETPGQFVVRASNNTFNMIGELGSILGPFLTACVVLGVAAEFRRKNNALREATPVLLLMLVQLVHLPPFVVFTRFVYLGVTPFLIFGSWQLLERFCSEPENAAPRLRWALILPVAALLLQITITGRDIYFGRDKHAEMTMTEMVARHVPKGASLMTSRFTVAYLAGNTMLFLPNDTLNRVLTYADNHSTSYALVTSRDELGKAGDELKTAERAGRLRLLDDWQGNWEDRQDEWARLYEISPN